MTRLTLPGSIPGLLRRGSPVHIFATSQAPGASGVVTGAHPWGYRVAIDHGVEDYWAPTETFMAEDIGLDLADATGRAHAAWWLAGEREASHIFDHRCELRSGLTRCWQVRAAGKPAGVAWLDYCCGLGWVDDGQGLSHSRIVPSLSALNPADARLLDDGSRWVDAEALRRVVLHVAEVAE